MYKWCESDMASSWKELLLRSSRVIFIFFLVIVVKWSSIRVCLSEIATRYRASFIHTGSSYSSCFDARPTKKISTTTELASTWRNTEVSKGKYNINDYGYSICFTEQYDHHLCVCVCVSVHKAQVIFIALSWESMTSACRRTRSRSETSSASSSILNGTSSAWHAGEWQLF